MTYKQDSIWPISPPSFKLLIILGPKVRIMKSPIVAVCVAAALAANPDLDQEWQMWNDMSALFSVICCTAGSLSNQT